MIVLRCLALCGRLVRIASRRAPSSRETPVAGLMRPVTWLTMVFALAVCVALALQSPDEGTGAGMVLGGAVALYVVYRRRLRRRW